jgi:uncharacterized protein
MNYQGAINHILYRLKAELSPNLKYHAVIHTISIIRNCRKIAEAENISDEDLQLLLTAAAYHDSGFLEAYERNETIGCRIARQALPRFSFTTEEIKSVCGMIMATRPPQAPCNKLEMILCDADLYYLGGDHYDDIAESLYQELQLNQKQVTRSQWLEMQIQSLEEHQYFTDFAKQQRDAKKHLILEKLKVQLENLNQKGA